MTRRANDAYFTIDGLAAECVSTFFKIVEADGIAPNTFAVLEPSVGGLSFAKGIVEWVRHTAYEYRRAYISGVDIVDYNTKLEIPEGVRANYYFYKQSIMNFRPADNFDYVLGNPPYDQALEHIWYCLEYLTRPNAAAGFLLRAGFMESIERGPFFAKFPVYAYCPITKRPSFTEDGKTDGTSYAFIIWVKRNNVWQVNPGIKHINYGIPPHKKTW